MQDLELGAALKVGLLGEGRLARAARWLYGRVLRSFDRVTTLSGRMRTALAAMGRDANRIGLFPNWVDIEKYRPVDASRPARRARPRPGQFVALYAGAMGEKQGVESLLDVARLLEAAPDIRVVLCGAGPARGRIEARLAGHPNVLLLDPQPEDRFLQLLSMADCHLLPQKRGVTHFVMPSKLGPMLASGKPIVAQAEEDCVVRETLRNAAIVVGTYDAPALAQATLALARDPLKREKSSWLPSYKCASSVGRMSSSELLTLCSFPCRRTPDAAGRRPNLAARTGASTWLVRLPPHPRARIHEPSSWPTPNNSNAIYHDGSYRSHHPTWHIENRHGRPILSTKC